MRVWRRTLLPAVAAVAALTSLSALSACGNGGGLRVEGADSQPTSEAPTPALGSTQPKAQKTPGPAVDLPALRVRLLADRHLPDYSRKVLVKCTVISRCLSRGTTVDVLHSGTPQQIVLIHSVDKFVFGIILVAVEPSGPRAIWSLKVDQPTVNASPQGDLVVESKVYTLDDRPCCPSGRRVEVYRWNGRQMTKVSSTDQ
ncbi:hypothetical protein AB0E69_24955 [Kribbella sp. NPDC026611]|uniref:hypothetical protein n=1 Tax=Kribbella sp. NPDC026611 TaxID=3154911 RepID=UPI0033FB6A22